MKLGSGEMLNCTNSVAGFTGRGPLEQRLLVQKLILNKQPRPKTVWQLTDAGMLSHFKSQPESVLDRAYAFTVWDETLVPNPGARRVRAAARACATRPPSFRST